MVLLVLAVLVVVVIAFGGFLLYQNVFRIRYEISPTQYSTEESWSLVLPGVTCVDAQTEQENIRDEITNWDSAIGYLKDWYLDVYSNPGTDINYEIFKEDGLTLFDVRGIGVREDGTRDEVQRYVQMRLRNARY